MIHNHQATGPGGEHSGQELLAPTHHQTIGEDEGWKDELQKLYLKVCQQSSKTKFLKSCVSEGLIPDGVKCNFNLAMDVNNQQLVQSIEEEMDFHSSRLLDRMYTHSQGMEDEMLDQQIKLEEGLRRRVPEAEIRSFIRATKATLSPKILEKENQLKVKLNKLRAEKIRGRLPPGWSAGSRNIKGFTYVRGHLGPGGKVSSQPPAPPKE